MGSSEGSTLQSVGLHVIATMPRSPRIGRRRRASATEMKSMSTPTSSPRFTSRASCSASRSLRAILSAPLWVKRSGWPVSAVKLASLVTARWASRVSAGVARTWLVSPAARGEVCEARAARSSTATRAPRWARWYATLAPKAPEPTTTTSAEAIMGTASRSAPSALAPQRLDVVQHGARVQEGRVVDLAHEALGVDQEHLQHVRHLPPGPAARAIDRDAEILAEAVEQRLERARRARGEEVPADATAVVHQAAAGVAPHHGRRVTRGIERERDQPDLPAQIRTLTE